MFIPIKKMNFELKEPTDTSKQPIRTRYLGQVTGYQPIRDQYFLIRPVPGVNQFHTLSCPCYLDQGRTSSDRLCTCFGRFLDHNSAVPWERGFQTRQCSDHSSRALFERSHLTEQGASVDLWFGSDPSLTRKKEGLSKVCYVLTLLYICKEAPETQSGEPTDTSKQPIRSRYLGHLNDWLSANQGPVFPDS
eukprot:sb/3471086/